MTGDRRPRAVVFGCTGPVLRAEERALFRDADPLGFILFRRNVEDPDQVRRLLFAVRRKLAFTQNLAGRCHQKRFPIHDPLKVAADDAERAMAHLEKVLAMLSRR